MKRYSNNTSKVNGKNIYLTTRYPEIPLGHLNNYVYTTKGDRMDILAQIYYNDSSLWWIISKANPNIIPLDSIYLPVGKQIRIPHINQLPQILLKYKEINSSTNNINY